MKSNRRNFLKVSGLTGLSLLSSKFLSGCKSEGAVADQSDLDSIREQAVEQHRQRFNMCGYAAPKIETVRTGHIGLGSRGPGHASNVGLLEGVEVKALCDIIPEQVERTKKRIESLGFKPDVYAGDEEAWKKMKTGMETSGRWSTLFYD